MVPILSVLPNSIAKKYGILAGDILCRINGQEIRDVLDYRFYMTDEKVTIDLLRKEKEIQVKIHKEEYDDIGLCFETPLMDKKHSCANKCVFCFIDQLPEGMRESLYFKDDDDRLSFLHGNYVTLTNLKQQDIDRIIKMHISPVNISVHTTNPELRVQMMKNKHAGEVLGYIQQLADANIALCTQIVLCKDLNDGKELDRTMHDLVAYYPSLRSCAIVPVGLTKYREKLYPLKPLEKEDCIKVIEQVNAFGEECLIKYGQRLFFCSDEFYLKAELPLPDETYYEDYSQIENGVGMITSQTSEFDFELSEIEYALEDFHGPRRVTLITGVAAYEHIKNLSQKLMEKVPGLTVQVVKIINHFFGESVTVAGLLTGKDVLEQLQGIDLGDEVLFPSVMLRADEEVFLDDKAPKDLENAFHVPFRASKTDGEHLFKDMLGIR